MTDGPWVMGSDRNHWAYLINPRHAKLFIMIAALLSILVPPSIAPVPRDIELRKATTHPMQYYLSLPSGWKKGANYPVVVAIESADRDFRKNAQEFVQARGSYPFIVVAPLVLTGGGSQVRDIPVYSYSAEVWDSADKGGHWKFDEDGIQAILKDAHQLFGGEQKVYVTGWEAGCHTVWALIFNHPEWFKAAAVVCPNYQGRWLVPRKPPNKSSVPIRVFSGARDLAWRPGSPLFDQTENAKKEAARRGFSDISTEIVPNQGHGALADSVMHYFFNQFSKK